MVEFEDWVNCNKTALPEVWIGLFLDSINV